jgi:hypothetical protein
MHFVVPHMLWLWMQIWCVCCSYSLCALCIVVADAAYRVLVTVFTCVAWGHSCYWCRCCGYGLCAMCIIVAGVVHRVMVAVIVPCVLWSLVQHIGSCSCSLYAWRGATVAVYIVCVLWVLSLHHVHCSYCLCAACGVTIALLAPYGVSPVPLLHQVWCCSCGHCTTRGVCGCRRGSNRAARRDVAMWRTQLERA